MKVEFMIEGVLHRIVPDDKCHQVQRQQAHKKTGELYWKTLGYPATIAQACAYIGEEAARRVDGLLEIRDILKEIRDAE